MVRRCLNPKRGPLVDENWAGGDGNQARVQVRSWRGVTPQVQSGALGAVALPPSRGARRELQKN